MKIKNYIINSKTNKFASIYGKSTVVDTAPEYTLMKNISKSLVEKGWGVIHGGYAGGMMQAATEGANEIIQQDKLPVERNIAVPQIQHDAAGWERVDNASFVESTKDIFERLRCVTSNSDVCIIAPLGGDGTMLEVMTVWHENVIAKHINKDPVPMVFLETERGTQWREILNDLCKGLDNGKKSFENYEWVSFLGTIKEFNQWLDIYENTKR